MTPLQPRLTIQNLTGKHWLVTVEHVFSEHDSITITTRVPKGHTPPDEVARQCFARAAALIAETGPAEAPQPKPGRLRKA